MTRKRFEEMTLKDLVYLMKSEMPKVIPLPTSIKKKFDPEFAELLDLRLLPLFWLPSLNGKGVAALMILLMELEAGNLKPGTIVVVPSSGNTVMSVAFLARLFGLAGVVAVIDVTTPPLKQDQIWKAGAAIVYPDPGETVIEASKRIARERGGKLINQYVHEGSWSGHLEWTLPHIVQQTDGELSVVCAAAGTTSMVWGAEQFCRKHVPHVNVVGVASMSDEEKVPGSRSPKGLEEVGFPYRQLRTPILANVTRREAYEESLGMIREFCPGGPTLGLQVAGSLRHFEHEWKKGRIGKYLNGCNRLLITYVGMDMHVAYNYREVLERK